MNKTQKTTDSIRKMTVLAILAAIIVVLQCFCSVLTIPGFNVAITLTLVPILVGAAIYGIGAGAFLGAVFGVVVLVTDPTAAMLMTQNLILTAVLCIGKGVLAGVAAGAMYKLLTRNAENNQGRQLLGVILGGIAAPIANTGAFVLGMVLFFKDTIYGWSSASGSPSFLYYVLIGLCGINFVVELFVNLILSTGIVTIIKAVGLSRKRI